MNRRRSFTVMPGLALALLLALGACDTGPTEDPEDLNITRLTATAANFDEILASIKDEPGNYLVTIQGNITWHGGFDFGTPGVSIILKGTGTNQIGWYGGTDKNFASVSNGVKLVLENIRIWVGKDAKLVLENIQIINTVDIDDWISILDVDGTLEIKNGALIRGNGNFDTNKASGILLHGTLTMSGGELKGFETGIRVSTGTFTMSGGVIKENTHGIATANGAGAVINLDEGTVTDNTEYGVANWSQSKGASITLSGTVIEKGRQGVYLAGENTTFTMSGGKIKNASANGIHFDKDGKNITFTMTAGTISGGERGISVNGDGHKLTINGGTIENITGNGINFDTNGKNNTFTMTDGTISGGGRGISVDGDGHELTINGGTIENNNDYGIRLGGNGKNLTFAMTGGTIRGSNGWGISMGSADSSLNISGGTINGKEAANAPNKSGAVTVQGGKSRATTFTSGSLEAKTNAQKNGVADSFKGGWD